MRHGKTRYQEEGLNKIYPRNSLTSIPLSQNGKEEIKKKAKELKEKIDIIYSSDFLRTRQTAQLMAKELNVEVKLKKEFRDIDLGSFHGKNKREFKERFSFLKDFSVAPEGGESYEDLERRALRGVLEIEKNHQGENILIISHGDTLLFLEKIIKGLKKEEVKEIKETGKGFLPGEIRKLS